MRECSAGESISTAAVGVERPNSILCQSWVITLQRRTVPTKFERIAIDTSKHVFTHHGVHEQDRPMLRRELKRSQVEAFFSKQEATEVVLEACGGSRHWGRV